MPDRSKPALPIPVNQPALGSRERELVLECIDTGWISSEGPFVAEFEREFARSVGRAHGVAVASGTAALDVAVKALGIGAGDEVIMPAFTIISPALALVRAGATPVLTDVDPDSWNMTAEGVAARITPRTRAILAVHLYGLPIDMPPLLDVAAAHGLHVIEDAAEMHGQTCRGRACGSFGALSIFSFYANKLVTTGEGGMVVTDDAELAERCRSLRNLCFGRGAERFIHHELGWNYRMTNLQAALGLAQLERVHGTLERKRGIGRRYDELLRDVADLQLPLSATDYADNCYWVYGVVERASPGRGAAAIIEALADAGVGARPFFWPMHEQPVFREMGLFEGEEYPVSSRLARHGLYVPAGAGTTDEQVTYAAEALIGVMEAG